MCTTELGRVAQLKKKFEDRKTKVLALSVDKVDNHGGWVKDINEIVGCTVDFPIVADPDRRISCLYGMLNQEVRNINTQQGGHEVRVELLYCRSNLTSTLFLLLLIVVSSTWRIPVCPSPSVPSLSSVLIVVSS